MKLMRKRGEEFFVAYDEVLLKRSPGIYEIVDSAPEPEAAPKVKKARVKAVVEPDVPVSDTVSLGFAPVEDDFE